MQIRLALDAERAGLLVHAVTPAGTQELETITMLAIGPGVGSVVDSVTAGLPQL
jgi:peptidyl-tRNA hydrolase